jgi:opacity protein-like surface antigen
MTLRSIALILLALGAGSAHQACAQAFTEGSHSFSVGHGFGTFLGGLSSNFDQFGDVKYTGTGPLYVKYEHAVNDHIGLGVNVAYAANKWAYNYENDGARYTETTERTTYSILARFNYHFGNSDKFDPYLGLGMGYRDANWDIRSDSPYGNSGVTFKSLIPFGFELTVGARYFFLENLGVYAEMGGAKSVFQGGLAARF